MRQRLGRFYSRHLVLIWAISAALTLFTGCGSGFDKGYPSYISTPTSAVRVNQTLQLSTEMLTTGSSMSFWVNGVPGGDAKVGTVDSKGMYTAPAVVPTPSNT